MSIATKFQAIMGAALAALYDDATLHRATLTDDGQGGFAVADTDRPVKALVESLSESERVAAGLPRDAVRISLLRAGLDLPIAVDDAVTVDGTRFRITAVETDPAQAAYSLMGVPV